MQARTVQVGNVSDLAGEREIREFFSFSGEIERVEIRGAGVFKTAFVTFRDTKALEIAVLLSGSTIVDQIVSIKPAIDYVPRINEQVIIIEDQVPNLFESSVPIETSNNPGSRRVYVSKAHDMVTGILARGSALGQDALNKAKAFDEKHQFRANASAKVISFHRRVGISEKFTLGMSAVNERVKSMDQRLHVSDKTMAVITVAEQKLNDTGTAVKANRFVMAGTDWLNGAFGKMARAGHFASSKTREKFQFAVSNLTAKDTVLAA